MLTVPMGPVTLLFSDIEGSTRLLHLLGDEGYLVLLQRHRVLLREVFDAHGGREIGTEGDSFFVTFDDVGAAVGAALAAQLALSDQGLSAAGLRVRMGLHSGEALQAEGGLYGMVVHEAARVATAAHGGQVLLSGSTAELAAGALPTGAGLVDLGEHRLKDLGRAQRLWQLKHPGLEDDFAPVRSLEHVRHNLPVQTSSFIGREEELRAVAKLIGQDRLVSLLGPGGTGKTRLAYQVAAQVVEDFPGGVWVVELAGVTDPAGVPTALLRALGLREERGREHVDTVVGFLRDRVALVVVDNCEQVIAAAAALVHALLTGCPDLRVLATSREPLRLGGEVSCPVPGLRLPESSAVDYLDQLAHADAVRLFTARAEEVRSGFTLTADNAAQVAALCARLDGLPLAIELAAARARILTPGQILERLDHSLDLLTKGARTSQDRQANLRGAIDWSHQLLSEPEQLLFRRLSVFTGGWRLEAAEHVCSAQGLDRAEVLEHLDNLVDKSLVAVGEDPDGQTRYRLLEIIGEYAAERLQQAGETHTLLDRHAQWCQEEVAAGSSVPPGGLPEAAWYDLLQAEHPNLLAALDHLNQNQNPAHATLALQLAPFWQQRGHARTGQTQLTLAWQTLTSDSPELGRVLYHLATLSTLLGDHSDGQAHYERALSNAREVGDRKLQGSCLAHQGVLLMQKGRYASAQALLLEALELARDSGHTIAEHHALRTLGSIAADQGDLLKADTYHLEALAVSRRTGHRRNEGISLNFLGMIAVARGEPAVARSRYEQALAIAYDLGDKGDQCYAIVNLGQVALQDNLEEARALCTQALGILREIGDRRGAAICLVNLAEAAYAQQDFREARTRYEEALELCRQFDRMIEAFVLRGLGDVAAAAGDDATSAAHLAEAIPIHRELGDRPSEVRSLCTLSSALARLADATNAVTHLDAALGGARDLDDLDLTWRVLEAAAMILSVSHRHGDALSLLGWADRARSAGDQPRPPGMQKRMDALIEQAHASLGAQEAQEALAKWVTLNPQQALDLTEQLLAASTPAPTGGGGSAQAAAAVRP
jgi:predicted ATPase/class 3 adenylate cyclase